MARYGQAFKDKALARLLPPESAPVEVVSREVGVGVGTLERWREDALAKPGRTWTWSAGARFEAVITTAAMNEASKSAWCRELFASLLANHTGASTAARILGYQMHDSRAKKYWQS